jgi:hypothetical protein
MNFDVVTLNEITFALDIILTADMQSLINRNILEGHENFKFAFIKEMSLISIKVPDSSVLDLVISTIYNILSTVTEESILYKRLINRLKYFSQK